MRFYNFSENVGDYSFIIIPDDLKLLSSTANIRYIPSFKVILLHNGEIVYNGNMCGKCATVLSRLKPRIDGFAKQRPNFWSNMIDNMKIRQRCYLNTAIVDTLNSISADDTIAKINGNDFQLYLQYNLNKDKNIVSFNVSTFGIRFRDMYYIIDSTGYKLTCNDALVSIRSDDFPPVHAKLVGYFMDNNSFHLIFDYTTASYNYIEFVVSDNGARFSIHSLDNSDYRLKIRDDIIEPIKLTSLDVYFLKNKLCKKD